MFHVLAAAVFILIDRSIHLGINLRYLFCVSFSCRNLPSLRGDPSLDIFNLFLATVLSCT